MARGIFLGSVGALVVCAATVVFGTSDAQEFQVAAMLGMISMLVIRLDTPEP